MFFKLYKWYQIAQSITYVVRCAIWHHLYNLKNVKNTHGGVLILVKLQLKLTLLHGCFARFLICINGTKSHKASHINILNFPARIVSKVTINTATLRPWCRSGVFIVNFEQISHIVLLIPLLTLNK